MSNTNGDRLGAILIRGIERVAGTLIDGPCRVVDHILAFAGDLSPRTRASAA